MKLHMNTRFIEDVKVAREVMLSVAAALYTGMNRNTPMSEAAEVAGICASMWKVCDALGEIAGGERA